MINKILLLGNTGQLGWELNRSLVTLGELTAMDYPKINMADPDSIRRIVREVKPNLIVNATAYTDVDKAEGEPELAMAINGTGPGVLAEEAKKLHAALVHFSTDYVFDGKKGEPYKEDDPPSPLNVYGRTKLAGEQAVQAVDCTYFTFRTSWVYSMRRPCFVTKVLEWARQHETLRIVDDQISSPTWARMLADATTQVIAQGHRQPVQYIKENRGLFHLSGGGTCSRYEWAKAIIAMDPNKDDQIIKQIEPAKSIEFSTPAERPYSSVLDKSKFKDQFSLILPDWLQQVLSLSLIQS